MSGADEAFDVAIVGGGLVGASLAIALADGTPLRVALIEGTAPAATGAQPSFDDRTTALGNATRRIFESLGVWSAIEAQAAPIARIHVSDAGHFGFARLEAAEQGVAAFGYVVTNRVIGQALHARLTQLPRLQRCMPAHARAVRLEDDAVSIELEGARLRARLVVAADGADSLVRAAAGVAASVEDYRQVAVIAHVESTRASEGTAYERFTPTGPLAVLPLVGPGCGLVWTLSPAAAERAMGLTDGDFLAELQRCFGWRLGRFTRVGRRAAYPLRLSRAEALTARRTVLIGNAAQALHPVAGQGFNLGLRDAATLAETLAETLAAAAVPPDGVDVGDDAVLQAFARARAADREGVTRFTDGLVKLVADGRPPIPALRNAGLLAFDLLPPAKAALARVSWGFGGTTPRLARGLGLGR